MADPTPLYKLKAELELPLPLELVPSIRPLWHRHDVQCGSMQQRPNRASDCLTF